MLGGVHLLGTNLSTGAIATDNKLPFFGRDAAAFAEGLDYYIDGAVRGPEHRLVVAGPDALDFIHVLTVEPRPKAPGFTDLLQYGGGLKLARAGSAFDPDRGEVWLQVVYDTTASKPGLGKPAGAVVPGTYLKRYGVGAAGLENTVEDPFATTALEYDPVTKMMYGVGVCKGNGAGVGVRCLVRCDPSEQFPKMASVAVIGGVGKLLGGVSALAPGPGGGAQGSSVMHIVAAVGGSPPSHRTLFRCVGGETGTCYRAADADTGSTGRTKWALVGVNVANGSVTSTRPLGWAAQLESLPLVGLSA